MPISRKEFETGELDLSFLIAEFLRSNSENAYTADELIEQLASKGVNVRLDEMRDVLRSLEKQEKVETKTVGGVIYYIYYKPRLGFRV